MTAYANEKLIAKRHGLRLIKCTDMGPDDGNPYFVMRETDRRVSASLACALDTGELDGPGGFPLTSSQLDFLQAEAYKLDDY